MSEEIDGCIVLTEDECRQAAQNALDSVGLTFPELAAKVDALDGDDDGLPSRERHVWRAIKDLGALLGSNPCDPPDSPLRGDPE